MTKKQSDNLFLYSFFLKFLALFILIIIAWSMSIFILNNSQNEACKRLGYEKWDFKLGQDVCKNGTDYVFVDFECSKLVYCNIEVITIGYVKEKGK